MQLARRWTLSENDSSDIRSPGLANQLMEFSRLSALAELASGIAHELNQSLGAIATFAQTGELMLSRTQPLVNETLGVLRQINDAALSAGQEIRRIRRHFDQQPQVRSSCQIPELIKELKPVMELCVERAGGQLHLEISHGIPAVLADRLQIQHVVVGLVQNACDASALCKGIPKIAVSTASNRYMVEISVRDSGPGVPASIQRQLFRPFFTTKHCGTGLGLSSSKAIVEAHEGTMGFENLSSGGSRFWLRLPAASSLRD
jgi:C4-dicarboxylate-specific signal transduction histidine kinase